MNSSTTPPSALPAFCLPAFDEELDMDLAEEQLMCSPNTQSLLVGGHESDDQPMSYRDAVHVFSSDPVSSQQKRL